MVTPKRLRLDFLIPEGHFVLLIGSSRFVGQLGSTLADATLWPEWLLEATVFRTLADQVLPPHSPVEEPTLITGRVPPSPFQVQGFEQCWVSPLLDVGTFTQYLTQSFRVSGLAVDGQL